MCYIGYLNDDSSVAKMATEDIKVLKIMTKVGSNFIAPFIAENYTYPKTRLQRSNKLDIQLKPGLINIFEGLHSYSSKILHMIIFHSDVITECYIPKGSIYFTNGREYVSQELIFDKSYDHMDYIRYYSSNLFKIFFMKKPKPIYVWKD